MKVYEGDRIRNVGFVGHGGSGKTSLVETILYNNGLTSRIGRVEDGNTMTDYLPEEVKRKMTINLASAPIQWKDNKINIIDTPGYSDFIGEVLSVMEIVEGLVFTVCACSGVEVQTEIFWEKAKEKNLPRVIYINKMDREHADFDKTFLDLQNTFKDDKNIIPFFLPIGSESNFKGVIDIINAKAYVYNSNSGKYVETEIPEELEDKVKEYYMLIVEAAAEHDDELLMKYLDGEELHLDEIKRSIKQGVKTGEISPILCGSALKNMGLDLLLDIIMDYMPSPIEVSPDSEDDTLEAFIFKTLADPFVGKISHAKILKGTINSGSVVYNLNREVEEKIGQLCFMCGKEQIPISEVKRGDIVSITRLQNTLSGDLLSVKNNMNISSNKKLEIPIPNLAVAIRPSSKGDEEKLGNALNRLLEEDLTMNLEKNTETRETLLRTMGELHTEVITEKLLRKFGVDVQINPPKVPYKETIKMIVLNTEGKHKKQSGGHGQYGHVFLDVEPCETEFEFKETIFGGSVPKQYIPAVEKGVREAMSEGIIAGYPITNVRVTLKDGSYHPVDSSEMAFKIAASLAFRKALEKAKSILLEPIMNVRIMVPEVFMGDIIGDLNSKRGKILGMELEDKYQVINALVPLAEMFRYTIDLKSITQGKGHYNMTFSRYEEVPEILYSRIIETNLNLKNNLKKV